MPDSRWKRLTWWSIPISIYALYLLLNITISQMNLGGLAVNSFALVILTAYILTSDIEIAALFFGVNSLLGPFLFVNFQDLALPNLGRMDYIVCILLIPSLLITQGALSKFGTIIIIACSILIIWGEWSNIQGIEHSVSYVDAWFGIIGKLATGAMLYYILSVKNKIGSNTKVYWLILLVLVTHLLISWLQFVFQISLRAGTLEAALSIAGFTINRPVGLLEASYVYGINTFGMWYLTWHFIEPRFRNASLALLILALPVSIVSTRSVSLGIMLFMLTLMWQRASDLGRSLYALALIFFSLWVFNQGAMGLTLLDQSNSSKLLMWWTVLTQWANGFPSMASFLGYGHNSAALVAKNSVFFDLANSLGAIYDNRIDNLEGFPLHNVYIQILFEYGLFAALIAGWLLIWGAINVFKGKVDVATSFMWCITVTNYSVHNGIFSPWLTAFMLLAAFPSPYEGFHWRENKIASQDIRLQR